MNGVQVAYAVALLVLTYPAWGRQRYALGWLWANLAGILAICLAMDLGAIDRDTATVSILLTDLIAGVGLAVRPGVSRIIAWGYAITIPIYFPTLIWGKPIDATFGLVYSVIVAQMGVFAIGCLPGSGFGGGGRRGRFADRLSVASSGRDGAPSGAIFSRDTSRNRVRG